jgi:hypothetical protein
MIAELDRTARVGLDQLSERCRPLQEGCSPKVLAVEVKEIEGKHHEPMPSLVDGRAQRVEVRDAVPVPDNKLAIDQRCLAWQLGGSIDHATIGSCPIPAMTGIGSDPALLDDDQRPVAVVLDLMYPPGSGWWFRHKRRDFRPDEAERGRR